MKHILIRPLINEKSMNLITGGFFTFEIGRDATKGEVAKVVAEKFKVNPVSVRIVNVPAKRKMQRTRKGSYTVSGFKKAIVKLKPGQKIGLFEQAQPEEEVEVRTAEGEKVAKVKEKKSLFRDTKVRVEKMDQVAAEKKEKVAEEGQRGGEDLKSSHKESKKKGAK
jgi:large subunit ribosomal protein L23